ncbi:MULTISPECIES: hypothetical protein [Streptomyces]|uniref:DNA-binding protein n=2 Tax=Streptomyces TaxID=1883 RepID=A0ABU4KHX8_9ACTN|nr:hypothetical protein [Streptomyces roseolus]MDX2297393.1 hypothetical protein [Streptomyces roseolus]
MRWWRRSTPDPSAVADGLRDRADHLALTRPETPEALAAARDAAAAAAELVRTVGDLAGRRRLARALWRETSALLLCGRGHETEGPARRCWETCTLLLAARGLGDAAQDDELTGEVVGYLGVLTAACHAYGRPEDVPRLLAAGEAAVARSAGPRTEQARARLDVFPLAPAADAYAAARIAGQWPLVALETTRAVVVGKRAAETLRRHAHEGPTEVVEFARALQLVSRLLCVSDRIEESASALDEAITAMSGWARRGPSLAAFLQGLRAERAGLDALLAHRARRGGA